MLSYFWPTLYVQFARPDSTKIELFFDRHFRVAYFLIRCVIRVRVRNYSLIRPPNMHVGGLVFTMDSSFFLSFFFRPLISEVAEWNSTISSHVVRSKCDLKIHVRNLGYPFPYKSGAQKLPFMTI